METCERCRCVKEGWENLARIERELILERDKTIKELSGIIRDLHFFHTLEINKMKKIEARSATQER